MKTLVQYYEEEKEELRQRLQKATTIEKVVEIVQIEISKLADISGEYIDGLTPLQGRVAIGQLTVLSVSLEQLIVLKEQNKISRSKAEETETSSLLDKKENKAGLERVLITLGSTAATVGTALFMGNVANIAIPYLLASSALGGVSVGGIVEIFKDQQKTKSLEKTKDCQTETPIFNSGDIDRLLSELEQQLKAIDRDVAKYTEPKPPPKPTVENHPDVLEFLQNLIGDAHYEESLLPDYTRRRIEQLPTILRNYQIEAKFFELSQEEKQPTQEQEEMFEFEPSLNPDIKDYVTLVPALVKDKKIIKQGRVIKPASKTVGDNETKVDKQELLAETSLASSSSSQPQPTELEPKIVEELVAETPLASSSSSQPQPTELEPKIVEELVAETPLASSSSPQPQPKSSDKTQTEYPKNE